MADPAAVAAGQQKLSRSGNTFMGMTFRAIADILKSIAGPSFQDDKFVANVGNIQINRIGATNQAGETVNDLLRIATAGVWNDVQFQIAAPSDRFRIILGLKLTLVSTDDADVVGAALIEEPWIQQLIALGLLRLDRSRGRMTVQRLWQFMTGADNSRFQTPALAGGNQAIQLPVAQPRIPSEQEILPLGLASAMYTPIDAINPQDRAQFTLAGLAGVDLIGAYADDLAVGVDAIVLDAVMSGQ